MTRLLDSWRTDYSRDKTTELLAPNAKKYVNNAVKRFSDMTNKDLSEWIEVNFGGMGRNIRDWRQTDGVEHLHELHLAAYINLLAVRELEARGLR